MFSKSWLHRNLCLLIAVINTIVQAGKIKVIYEEVIGSPNCDPVTYKTETNLESKDLGKIILATFEISNGWTKPNTQVKVAIKMADDSETGRELLINEVLAYKILRAGFDQTQKVCDNVRLPIVYGYGTAKIGKTQRFVMVMERFDMNFSEYRKKYISSATEASANRADISKAFSIGSQILPILQFSKSKALVHLDIKPENIMLSVDENGEATDVVLIDYESACYKGSILPVHLRGSPEYDSYSSHTDETLSKQQDNVWEYRDYLKKASKGMWPASKEPKYINAFSIKDDLESLFFVLFNSAIKKLIWIQETESYRATYIIDNTNTSMLEKTEKRSELFNKIQSYKKDFIKEIQNVQYEPFHNDLKTRLISLWEDIRNRNENNDDDFNYSFYLNEFNTISNMLKVVK